jgi:hypothetical protein
MKGTLLTMNLRNSVSLACGALLLSGLSLQQANAQVVTFTDIAYSQAGATFTGTNGPDTVSATAGTAVEALGVITDPLTNFSFVGPVGGYTIDLTGGTGDLNIVAGVASFTLDPGYTVTGGPVSALDLTFIPSSTTVTGTTTVVGGVSITTGTLTYTGSQSVTNVTLVPEPGTVSLLAGLAVVGSGLGLRRRRKA